MLDFLSPPRPPRIGWVLLGAGLLALLGALWQRGAWGAERDAAAAAAHRQATAAVEAEQRQRERAANPGPEEHRLRFVREALQRPWLPMLRALDAGTRAPVYLLALSVDPVNGAVQVKGEAPSFDHAVAYVQALEESGTLRAGVLTSHEEVGSPAGPVVRFAVSTAWVLP